jgi:hypothetical protein
MEITYNSDAGTYHPHLHILTGGQSVNDWCEHDIKAIKKIARIWKRKRYSEKRFNKYLQLYSLGKITAGYFKAALLQEMWLEYSPTSWRVAQDVRAANAGSLKELFKYSTKVLTKSKRKNKIRWQLQEYKSKSGEVKQVYKKKMMPGDVICYVSALDKIYCALKNKRVLQPIGYTKEEQKEFNEINEGEIQDDLKAVEFNTLPNEATAWQWHKNDWREITNGIYLSAWRPTKEDKAAASCFVFDSG